VTQADARQHAAGELERARSRTLTLLHPVAEADLRAQHSLLM
jgi:hypothetical protein